MDVIAISGGIGSGKALLGRYLADQIDADHVSFGNEVRRYAVEHGTDAADRSVLQHVGQALVEQDLDGFVSRTLAQASGKESLVISGLRHVEVLLKLRELLHPRRVKLVHLKMPTSVREERLMKTGMERRLVGRFDNDITEDQVRRVLPRYADLEIDGDLPLSLQAARIWPTATPNNGNPR